MIACTPKSPSAFRLTRATLAACTGQERTHCIRTATLRLAEQRGSTGELDGYGTVPQTGVLMVTHERNMRSKFR